MNMLCYDGAIPSPRWAVTVRHLRLSRAVSHTSHIFIWDVFWMLPSQMAELLKEIRLINKKWLDTQDLSQAEREDLGTVAPEVALAGKVVCLFFSAAWCTPCLHFVPALKEMYEELTRRGEELEIVFISFDKTEDDMMDYYQHQHGDWLALKFGDPLRNTLVEKYSISVIPKLVVIQPSGDVITPKGRKDVQDKGLVCMRAWQAGMIVKGERHEAEPTEEQQDSLNALKNVPAGVS
ncbi:nucleoredoxin-like protein 2 [Elysia marginata]|uniref:Nucleoredoxin-like protein 2 n=1 Tax=Elysia marginata TaxID=1093978 RepID=A0AAV4IJ98_9GAST|nr:nucleoredoxin-like protein 2 [Elysia marginata]